tara:strand:+ start:148 stop:462 length:315 start_codon:yes stop_codon:yes gene_type:complete
MDNQKIDNKFFIVNEALLDVKKKYKKHNNEIGFFFEDNILKAFSSYCPHLGGPLECVDNKEFYCHFHGYKFSKKGECISHKIKLNVVFFKVTIEEGRVYVWENL